MKKLSIISWVLTLFLGLLSAFFFFINQDLNAVFAGLWVPVLAVLGLQFYLLNVNDCCANKVAKIDKNHSKKSSGNDSKDSNKSKSKES